ncbi:MAG: PIN domain-containing protein [Actinomycetes bacterium]
MLTTTPVHYEHAAGLYRHARWSGVTVRRLVDCLIAAVAIDHDVPVLHADRDFDALSRVSPLVVAS